MTKSSFTSLSPQEASALVEASLVQRRKKEKRFRLLGLSAVAISLAFLVILFSGILSKGLPGMFQYYVELEVNLDRTRLDPQGDLSDVSMFAGEADQVILEAALKSIGEEGGRKTKKALRKMLSSGSSLRLIEYVQQHPEQFGTNQSLKFALDDDIDSLLRGFIKRETPEADRRINDFTISIVDKWSDSGLISYELSDYLFFGSASRDAEMAGIKGALIGSLLTLVICVSIAFPLGVAAAVYLEEIAPKNRFTEIIEININNLAAVPSVVFGIMGLAIFIVTFGMPRSVPLVGGIVLALMTLPTIIISSRAAIRAVPPSIRDAALGIGASKMQTIFHHVIPLAMPGMLTGTIIGMAQALGETAPLLMIGMVAFIVDIPGAVTDPATVLPVQIFMWADFPERMFVQKTSAAIIVLLAFLITMNASAIALRKKLERRW
ncbi:phosphate ABC transporter permease PstA [Marinobacterium sp. LSUCC0821]|jgi:phosphate transport system permease protein|uniref:phosphate ABC transporter permease PstA n=1 Tax=Marinobacterium sp. LSUCC0821 TaxID=2668067 RepID=UPI0014522BCC|nr:phosphate ABC transporter permease PstA [Marinobacterium sp. LSUCC0821]QJD71795.1 phosphate ABC transporter permease PstA [Marinobacterium sp. LSUCC0821]